MANVRTSTIELKSPKEIGSLARSGRYAAELRNMLCDSAKPGMTTNDLDDLARDWIKARNLKPAFLNYRGFPKHICTSVNDEVVHGIPSSRKISNGDIISIDVGIFHEGWCGDTAKTVTVGEVPESTKKLLKVSEESLMKSIEAARVGNRLGDVSYAMQSVAEEAGYSVVRNYGGHGIGRAMHEEPHVPCVGTPGTGMRLNPGLVLALEVMVNEGKHDVNHLDDGWTVLTKDGSLSAHFEHMIAITEKGTEILTKI